MSDAKTIHPEHWSKQSRWNTKNLQPGSTKTDIFLIVNAKSTTEQTPDITGIPPEARVNM